MMNYIWAGIMVVAVITSVFTGNIEQVSLAAINGAGEGVKLVLELVGVMCFWTGIMEIASKSGLINALGRLLSPVTKILFPKIPQNSRAMHAIVMNMTANILGMSNAATPLGLNAMRELRSLSNMNVASDEMCTFVVINTASIQLIPATLIAMRASAASAAPTALNQPVWITSLAAITVGIITVKALQRSHI